MLSSHQETLDLLMRRSLLTSGYSSFDSTWPPDSGPLLLLYRPQNHKINIMSIFLRNNPSEALVHIQISVPTRAPYRCHSAQAMGRTTACRTARNSVCGYKAGLQHCSILAWVVVEVQLPGMQGDSHCSHQVVGLHPLRDWVQPEMSRKLSEADGHLQRPCWERTTLPVHRLLSPWKKGQFVLS